MHASPTSTMKPTCVKMLLSPPESHTPAIALSLAHRHDQDHHERQCEALVLGREHEEREQHAQREDPDRRVAGDQLLERELRPVERQAVRQLLPSELLERGLRLAGREPRCGAARDLGGGIAVVAADHAGPELCSSVTNEPSGTIAPEALRTFSFRMSSGSSRNDMSLCGRDLEGAAEAVEVVDVQRAEVDLHRLEQVRELHALRLRLVAVDVGAHLRRADLEAREHVRERRRGPRGRDDLLRLLEQRREA